MNHLDATGEMLASIVAAASGLLIFASVAKALAPETLSGSLALLGIAARSWIVKALAMAELIVGLACLLFPDELTVTALAASYSAFGAFALFAMKRPGESGDASCGCFGVSGSKFTAIHVVLNLAVAAAGIGLMATGVVRPGAIVGGGALDAVDFYALATIMAVAMYVVLTALPVATPGSRPATTVRQP